MLNAGMSRSPERCTDRLAVLVPAVVMFAIGLWGLDRGGMWRDEAATFQVARRSAPQIWHLVHNVDAVHGLYYLLMHMVLAPRPGEVLLRLPSVCGAAAAAGLVGALGTRLCRPRVGLWAGLLYAVTPMVGHYAQEGRSYALVAAGVAGATLLLLRAVRGGRWWPYAAVLAVTCLLHEFAVLVLVAHACTLALARVPGRVWRAWLCAAGAVVVVLLPLVLVSRGQAAQVAWLRAPDGRSVERLVKQFAGPSEKVLVPYLVLAALALRMPRPKQGMSLAAVAVPLVLLPPALLMGVSQISPLYDDRYVLYSLAGAPLLAAAGAERAVGIVGRLWAGGSLASTFPHSRNHPDGGTRVAPRGDLPGTGGAAAGGPPPSAPYDGDGAGAVGPRVPAPGRPAVRGGGVALRDAPWIGPPLAPRSGRRPSPVRRHGVAVLGAVAVCGVFAVQFPVLRADRSAAHRPDDLAAVSAAVARKVRPGDPVLFLPSLERRLALSYPARFRGVRDVALEVPAAVDGSLYGREAGPEELRRRLAGPAYVWVVGQPFALRPSWTPWNSTERVKLTVLDEDFVIREEYVGRGITLRLYVRREGTEGL